MSGSSGTGIRLQAARGILQLGCLRKSGGLGDEDRQECLSYLGIEHLSILPDRMQRCCVATNADRNSWKNEGVGSLSDRRVHENSLLFFHPA